MTVADLISILKRHDPAVLVAVRWVVDYDDMARTCEELRPGAVHAVQLCEVPVRSGGWAPLGGAKVYDLLNDDDDAGTVRAVLLG